MRFGAIHILSRLLKQCHSLLQGRLHHISDGAHAPFEKLGGKKKSKLGGEAIILILFISQDSSYTDVA